MYFLEIIVTRLKIFTLNKKGKQSAQDISTQGKVELSELKNENFILFNQELIYNPELNIYAL
jgi:hypothetical protein